MTLQGRFSSTRFSGRRCLLSWCAPFVLFAIFVVGLVERPAMAQDTSIQFASLDSLTADTADTKTRFSLLSIESTYGTQSLRGGALCLVGHGPNLQFPRTFCFYFEEGESPQRDDDTGYSAQRLPADGVEEYRNRLNDWLGNAEIRLRGGVVDSIASKIADAGEGEVLSVKDILGEDSAAERKIQVDTLSSNLALNLTDDGSDRPDFADFEGIMQAAHTLGAMAPRLRDAQRFPNLNRELEEVKKLLSEETNRVDSLSKALSKASSRSEALIWGLVPVSVWWFIPGFLGLVFGGGLVLFIGQSYFRKREKDQQESQIVRPKTAEEEPSRGSPRADSRLGEGGEEGSDGEALREQIDRLEEPIETVAGAGQALVDERRRLEDERKGLAREKQDLSNEREALARELSNLAERFERVSKIDEKLDERLREKENLHGDGTAQLVEGLLDLHETVCDRFGSKPMSPDVAKKKVQNLDESMAELWEAVEGIDGYESKTLSEIIERAVEKSSKAISRLKEVREWAADTLGRGVDQADDPIAQSQDQLRRVMEAASNGEEISTLGALREKVMNLRQEADRASSLEQDLSSVREERDGLKKKVADFEQKAERLEQKNSDIVECLGLICDKISIDPIDKSGDHWAEAFRRRLEGYTDNDWQALLGISASLLAFDEAKSATENNDALLEELDISDLENKLRLFSTKLERAGIQEMIPNAFSDGWLHKLFRAKAVIDAYFRDEHPVVKDAIDQAESVMRTLLHRTGGDYHTISLPASLDEQALPGGDPDTEHGSSILDLPGIKDKVKEVYEEKGRRIAYDVRAFPHRYDESGFKQATVYVPSPSWLTS